MTTTAQRLAADGGVELFYYVKITGLPYYFGSVIDPTVATSGAWTLPSGYTWVRGMDLPNDNLTQRIGDIIGGIADAERIRVTLKDFQAFDASGPYQYLARLFAPGRASLAGSVAELETTIANTDGAASTFRVRQCNAAIGTGGVVHVNGEAIGISAISGPGSDGRETLTIAARNKFPCATGYPPTPTHRTAKVDDILVSSLGGSLPGIAGRNQYVTNEPLGLSGRTAALYICAIDQHGVPLPETDAMCRLIGRITSVNTADAADYEIEIEGIASDLDSAPVASGLAKATIKAGQICLDVAEWGKFTALFRFVVGTDDLDGHQSGSSFWRTSLNVDVQAQLIADGMPTIITADELVTVVNKCLDAAFAESQTDVIRVNARTRPHLSIIEQDGERHFAFSTPGGLIAADGEYRYEFIHPGLIAGCGLLTVMGFATGQRPTIVIGDTSGEPGTVVADKPVASVFIPVSVFSGTEDASFQVIGGNAETADATTQSGGFAVNPYNTSVISGTNAVGHVRFGNGTIARLLSLETADASSPAFLHTHGRPPFSAIHDLVGYEAYIQPPPHYYVPEGTDATVEQVIVMPGDGTPDVGLGIGGMLGRILASGNPTSSSTLNAYAGIGLGWADILDTASFRAIEPAGVPRVAVVDSKTRFSDLFMAPAREYGWFLVWDPEQGKFSARKIGVPAESVAHAVAFNDSNRSRAGDGTAQKEDSSNTRGSWTLSWGYDNLTEKFRAPDFTIADDWVMSRYGGVAKTEKIQDKTIVTTNGVTAAGVLAEILRRSYFYRQPWLRCRRSINKAGLLLAPGTFHQVIDARVVNPFTGRVGATAADKLFCLLVGVTANPSTGACEVEYLVNRQDPSSLFRMWSPTALVDFAATSHGYNSGTGVLTLKQRYSSDGTTKDGIDFVVGDTVAIVSRDNDASFTYAVTSSVTAVAADGSTITVGTGLTALPSTTEVIVVLRGYDDATAARRLEVAFQGLENGVIEDHSEQQNMRWI